jgi:UrcA family protein
MNAVTFPLAVAASALTLAFATIPAHAGAPATRDDAPRVAVKYGDLDLATDAGAAALYRRIADAARDVCPGYYVSRDLQYRRNVTACRDDAVARAIQSVGSPRLAAIQAARTSRARAS